MSSREPSSLVRPPDLSHYCGSFKLISLSLATVLKGSVVKYFLYFIDFSSMCSNGKFNDTVIIYGDIKFKYIVKPPCVLLPDSETEHWSHCSDRCREFLDSENQEAYWECRDSDSRPFSLADLFDFCRYQKQSGMSKKKRKFFLRIKWIKYACYISKCIHVLIMK